MQDKKKRKKRSNPLLDTSLTRVQTTQGHKVSEKQLRVDWIRSRIVDGWIFFEIKKQYMNQFNASLSNFQHNWAECMDQIKKDIRDNEIYSVNILTARIDAVFKKALEFGQTDVALKSVIELSKLSGTYPTSSLNSEKENVNYKFIVNFANETLEANAEVIE